MKMILAACALSLVACGSDLPAADSGLKVEMAFSGGAARVGDNTLFVNVSDPYGAPMDADITLHLHMPAHAHGTEAPAPKVTRLSTGHYALSPVTFAMAGEWQVHVVCACPQMNGELEQAVDVQ